MPTMRTCSSMALVFALAVGLPACSTDLGSRMASTGIATAAPLSAGTPRAVTLRSHLGGTLAGDPTLRAGERIRFVPATNERFVRKTPVALTLPSRVPYEEAQDAQLFLLGYAVGYAAEVLEQFT